MGLAGQTKVVLAEVRSYKINTHTCPYIEKPISSKLISSALLH